MLEFNDREHTAAELIAALPCEVELPAELRRNFEKHGVEAFLGDRRRFPRIYCRSERNRAGMQVQASLPHLNRPGNWQSVYVTNVSRDGFGFLHSEALYPREQLRLIMLNGKSIDLEVVSCRRLYARCFDIGAQIATIDTPVSREVPAKP
jgi:hypothetical protein